MVLGSAVLTHAGQGPRLRCLLQRQRSHEIAEVISESIELEVDGVRGKRAARQPCPFDRALVFLDAAG